MLASSMHHFGVRLAACVLTGVLVFLSYPGLDWSALAWFALVPWMLALRAEGSFRRAVLLSWVAGLVTNLGGFYWIVGLLRDFAFLPLAVAIPVHVLLCAQQALVFTVGGSVAWWAARRGTHALVAWPAAMVLAETVIPLIFPWFFANSQGPLLPLIQTAELGGVWLVTAWLVLLNAALAERLSGPLRAEGTAWPSPSRRAWGIATVLLVANVVYGLVRVPMEDARAAQAPTVRIGMVQANIGIYAKGERQSLMDNLILHQQMSQQLEAGGAELIIWPETAFQAIAYGQVVAEDVASWEEARAIVEGVRQIDVGVTWLPRSPAPLPDDGRARTDEEEGVSFFDRVAPQRGFRTPLLTGVVLREALPPERAPNYPSYTDRPRESLSYNSVLLLDEDGRVDGRADKIRLMPFGESVPLARFLYRTTGINLLRILPSVSDFEPGKEVVAIPFDHASSGLSFRLGMMICYEDILPSFGRLIHRHRPHLLVNQTNDAWFGDTAEPWLHQTLGAFRTVEQRTWLLRSVNTGVTGVIDNAGRIREQTPTWEEALVLHDVAMLEARTTPYMLLGNWPGGLALLWFVGLIARRSREKRADRSSEGAQA